MTRFGTFKAVAAGMIVGGLIAYFLALNHLIRTEEGVVAVPRQDVPYTDSYVDIRGWDANEWAKHPQLTQALVKDKRASLVVRAAAEEVARDVLMLDEQQTTGQALRASPANRTPEQNRMQRLQHQARNSIRSSFDNARFSRKGR